MELLDIHRRDFLKSATLSVLSLSALALLPSGCAQYPEVEKPLALLSPKEYAILNALAKRILSLDKNDSVDVAFSVDQYLATLPKVYQSQFKGLLLLFEHTPFLFEFQWSRFTNLPPEAQDRFIRGWAESSIGWRRSAFQAVKRFCTQRYYMDERTWKRIGYDGPWVRRA